MQTNSFLDNYQIIKTLGTGYTGKVKLGRDIETNAMVALKILDPNKMDNQKMQKVIKSLQNELHIMQNLNHPHIVRFLGLVGNGKYKSKSGKIKTVAYAVIELAPKGEMFEVLFQVGPFNENLARYYMRQLVSALEYLHTNNIAHRDLKPENLLLDDNLNLKLADFGFATIVEDGQKNRTRLGTERYMCPELFTKTPYDASKADIFAAGVILFIFFSGHPPFHEGRPQDPYYNVLVKNKQKFWAFHSKQNKKRQYSETFKYLVTNMLAYNPKDRLNIEQVKNSEWLNEDVDVELAEADMQKYMGALKKTIEQNQSGNDSNGNDVSYRSVNNGVDGNKGLFNLKEDILKEDIDKILMGKVNENNFEGIKRVKCNGKVDLIAGIINTTEQLDNAKITWNAKKDKLTIKVVNPENDEVTMVKVALFKVNEKEFGVRLMKKRGNYIEFNDFKKKFLDLFSEKL